MEIIELVHASARSDAFHFEAVRLLLEDNQGRLENACFPQSNQVCVAQSERDTCGGGSS